MHLPHIPFQDTGETQKRGIYWVLSLFPTLAWKCLPRAVPGTHSGVTPPLEFVCSSPAFATTSPFCAHQDMVHWFANLFVLEL